MGAEECCTKDNNNNNNNNCSNCHLPRPKKKKVGKMADEKSLDDSIVFQYEDDEDEIIVATGTEKETAEEKEEEEKDGVCVCDGDTHSDDDDDEEEEDEWSDDDWSDGDTILTSSRQHDDTDVDFDDLFGPVCTDFSKDFVPPSNCHNRQERCSSPCEWSDDDNDDDYSIMNNAHLLGGVDSTAIDERKEKIRAMGKQEKIKPHIATKVKIVMEPTEVREDIIDHVESLAVYRFSLVKFAIADRMRFNRHVRKCHKAIEWCFDPKHRTQKLQELHQQNGEAAAAHPS